MGKNVVSTNVFRILESLNTCITKQNNKRKENMLAYVIKLYIKAEMLKLLEENIKIYILNLMISKIFLENMKTYYKIKITDKFYFDFINMK